MQDLNLDSSFISEILFHDIVCICCTSLEINTVNVGQK